ncbi:MAG: type II toxin-antitoxin system HicA family toxin [Candidatus Poribacteria bacterium]
MRIPRDIGGEDFAKLLKNLGYQITRQTGSHIRLTFIGEKEHHITIPNHKPIKIGTLNNILRDISEHHKISKKELTEKLWND